MRFCMWFDCSYWVEVVAGIVVVVVAAVVVVVAGRSCSSSQ